MYFTPTEVLNNMDKTFGVLGPGTVAANKITLTLPAVANKRHYIGSIVLTDTAGAGGNEKLIIKKGTTTIWEESFAVGQDKVRQFQVVPLVGGFGESVIIEVSATNLTAGKLYVIYYTK